MPRVYLAPTDFVDGQVRPSEATSHYLSNVLRLREGDRWAALDGQRRSWLCEIVDRESSRKIDEWNAVAPLPLAVEVLLALCKGSRFEDAVEGLAELGVERVVPMQTERTERGLPSAAKLLRWDQIAKSGSALANRLVPLEVARPQKLVTAVDELDPAHSVYCHFDGTSPSELLHPPLKRLTILIGPEGGFSPNELELLQGRARRLSLGPLTLRVETAAVCAACLSLELCRLHIP